MATGAWSWLKNIFRRGKTEVPPAEQVGIRDAVARGAAADAAELAARFAAREITLREFQAELYLMTRNAMISQYALGRGGIEALTAADQTAIEGMLRTQMTALRGFVQDIAAGTMTPEQIARRAEMYGEAAIEAQSRGTAAARGVTLEDSPPAHVGCRCHLVFDEDADRQVTVTWVTAGDERVCPICEGLADKYRGGRMAA